MQRRATGNRIASTIWTICQVATYTPRQLEL
jgi:hypothetical protein